MGYEIGVEVRQRADALYDMYNENLISLEEYDIGFDDLLHLGESILEYIESISTDRNYDIISKYKLEYDRRYKFNTYAIEIIEPEFFKDPGMIIYPWELESMWSKEDWEYLVSKEIPVNFSISDETRKTIICTCAVACPIVLDLDGDGVETVGLGDSQVMFDTDGDGRRTLTGWLNADDGFLVYDRDGDGFINDGREMFGNGTYRYDGEGHYVNGFENAGNLKRCESGYEALAQEDTNGDGVINHLDRNWSSFRVWRDLNQDGLSQADELFTLEDLGIAEINLGSQGGFVAQGDGNLREGKALISMPMVSGINSPISGFRKILRSVVLSDL